ncbi:hypothetical protein K466DRAFT_48376 [Polyporus arcularius HHB13444]|uniref:Uncharacterized protein n=1 Tax=Polyporus arcularius HHB13444 TaxID=1314778 RepID=A0A5C3PVJ5_9APHY|nr:hypothetical protein K466DRAFT_48376 [Polyporus arcularius HHB13444]
MPRPRPGLPILPSVVVATQFAARLPGRPEILRQHDGLMSWLAVVSPSSHSTAPSSLPRETLGRGARHGMSSMSAGSLRTLFQTTLARPSTHTSIPSTTPRVPRSDDTHSPLRPGVHFLDRMVRHSPWQRVGRWSLPTLDAALGVLHVGRPDVLQAGSWVPGAPPRSRPRGAGPRLGKQFGRGFVIGEGSSHRLNQGVCPHDICYPSEVRVWDDPSPASRGEVESLGLGRPGALRLAQDQP